MASPTKTLGSPLPAPCGPVLWPHFWLLSLSTTHGSNSTRIREALAVTVSQGVSRAHHMCCFCFSFYWNLLAVRTVGQPMGHQVIIIFSVGPVQYVELDMNPPLTKCMCNLLLLFPRGFATRTQNGPDEGMGGRRRSEPWNPSHSHTDPKGPHHSASAHC